MSEASITPMTYSYEYGRHTIDRQRLEKPRPSQAGALHFENTLSTLSMLHDFAYSQDVDKGRNDYGTLLYLLYLHQMSLAPA